MAIFLLFYLRVRGFVDDGDGRFGTEHSANHALAHTYACIYMHWWTHGPLVPYVSLRQHDKR